jgi:hypothetical protein
MAPPMTLAAMCEKNPPRFLMMTVCGAVPAPFAASAEADAAAYGFPAVAVLALDDDADDGAALDVDVLGLAALAAVPPALESLPAMEPAVADA